MSPPRTPQNETTRGINLGLAVAMILLHGWTLFAAPLLLPEPTSSFGVALWALAVLPYVLASVTLWALIHEGVHRHLHPDMVVNDRLSRLLSVLFGTPFRLLRLGHLSHHQLNGKACERPDIPRPTGAGMMDRAAFYTRLTFGIYLGELAGNLLGLAPKRVAERVVRNLFYDGISEAEPLPAGMVRSLTSPRARAELRLDGLAALALLAVSAFCYGEHWHWLLAGLLGRALVVSLVDNVFHYGAPLGDPHSGHNLSLPRWIERLVLNFNLHRIHHRHPNLPWTALPAALNADGDRYDQGFGGALVRQFRGPIAPAR